MWIVPPRLPHYPSKHTQSLCQIRPAKKISQGLVISLRDNSAIIEFLPPLSPLAGDTPPLQMFLCVPKLELARCVPPRCVKCIFEWSFNRISFDFSPKTTVISCGISSESRLFHFSLPPLKKKGTRLWCDKHLIGSVPHRLEAPCLWCLNA